MVDDHDGWPLNFDLDDKVHWVPRPLYFMTRTMAFPETHSFGDLFECLKLFEVEESSPTAGGERPARGFGTFLCTDWANLSYSQIIWSCTWPPMHWPDRVPHGWLYWHRSLQLEGVHWSQHPGPRLQQWWALFTVPHSSQKPRASS